MRHCTPRKDRIKDFWHLICTLLGMKYQNTFASYSVNDLKKAKQFYSATLGLNVEETPEGLSLHLGETDVFLYPKSDHKPATFTVLNFSVPEIEAAMKELKKQGVQFEHYREPPTDEEGIFRGEGPTIAWFKDPSGNILSIIEERTAAIKKH